MRVLFVCTANICRSAYAEVLARHLDPEHEFTSAGVHGWAAAPMDEHMAAEVVRRGADPASFRSRALTAAMVDEADLVLTAETRHRRFVLEERPSAIRKAFTFGQFERGLAAADSVDLEVDLATVRAKAATSTAADDVPDPYGLGPRAAADAADVLERRLGLILPALARMAQR